MPSTAYHCTRNTVRKECFEDHGNLPKTVDFVLKHDAKMQYQSDVSYTYLGT